MMALHTLAPYFNNKFTIWTLGFSLLARYSTRAGRNWELRSLPSLNTLRLGSAPRLNNSFKISKRFGILSAHATCSGDPIIGELQFTSAPESKKQN